MSDMNEAFEKWSAARKKSAQSGEELLWPSETLVRLFKGPYISGLDHRQCEGKRVIDIGFGSGNNLLFLATAGLSLAGTEVHEDICQAVTTRIAEYGFEADLRVGTNRAIPFDDNQFDFLVSWNVLHYEDNEADIQQALAEYGRVLKPGGRLFVSTTGPEHKILRNSTTLGGHRYQIGRDDDFRKGQVYFYFDAPNYIHHYFSQVFSDIQVGRTHDFLLTETLDWFIVTGVKLCP
jgi:ubiquinone/menaquinone biosynthesis C-methylase UbiE